MSKLIDSVTKVVLDNHEHVDLVVISEPLAHCMFGFNNHYPDVCAGKELFVSESLKGLRVQLFSYDKLVKNYVVSKDGEVVELW